MDATKPLSYIYVLINKINNKKYVGFTSKHPNVRFTEHCSSRTDQIIVRAIKKYGRENFIIKILYKGLDVHYTLNVMEPLFIKKLKPEYNATSGGDGIIGYKHTNKTKKFIGLIQMGRKASDKTKKLMSLARKGRVEDINSIKKRQKTIGTPITIDNILFVSKNEAAVYACKTYKMSRNTALRYIAKGITDFGSIKKIYNNENPHLSRTRLI